MEENAEENVDALFTFISIENECKYQVKLCKRECDIVGRNSLKFALDITTSLYWRYNQDQEIAFGIEDCSVIRYFYAENCQLVVFRSLLRCRVSFASLHQDYSIQDFLGAGNFSQVFMCTELKTHKSYALKCIKIKNQLHIDTIRQECNIMSKLAHSGVIKLYDIYRKDQNTYCLVTELVNGQSLDSILNKQRVQIYFFINKIQEKKYRMQERDIKMIVQQTLEILQFLHEHNVIHRDVKPNHIILNEKRTIKLIDLGLSIDNCDSVGGCGTPGYLSPELFTNKGIWSSKCDMFSLGIVFYQLLNKGVSCFHGTTSEQILLKNKQCKIDYQINGYSEMAIDLLQKMLRLNPDNRVCSGDALKHPFFNNNQQNESNSNLSVYNKCPRLSHRSKINADEQ